MFSFNNLRLVWRFSYPSLIFKAATQGFTEGVASKVQLTGKKGPNLTLRATQSLLSSSRLRKVSCCRAQGLRRGWLSCKDRERLCWLLGEGDVDTLEAIGVASL